MIHRKMSDFAFLQVTYHRGKVNTLEDETCIFFPLQSVAILPTAIINLKKGCWRNRHGDIVAGEKKWKTIMIWENS